jgi:hypothetical protein
MVCSVIPLLLRRAIEVARPIRVFMHFRIEEARVNTMLHTRLLRLQDRSCSSDQVLRPLH